MSAATNPLLLPGHDRDAVVAEITVTPSISLTNDTGDRIELGGDATARQYSRLYGNYLFGGAHLTGSLRRDERLEATATASFHRDVAIDTLTSGVDALVEPQSVRDTLRGDAVTTWHPNERSMIKPSLAIEQSTYQDNALLGTTRSISGDVTLARRFTEHTWIGVQPLVTRSHTERQPALTRVALFATLQRELYAHWELKARVGAERVGDTGAVPALALPARKARTFFSGEGELCWRGERLDGCLNASLGSEVSALTGLQRRAAVGASLTRRLDARRTFRLLFDYQRVSASAGGLDRALDSVRAQAGLDWRLAEHVTLSGELDYSRRTVTFGGAPHSAYAGVSLRWDPNRR